MNKKVELEKKYKFKNISEEGIKNNITKLIQDLKLEKERDTTYEDTYYENEDILEAYSLSVRKRIENGIASYILKEDQDVENNLIKRTKIEFKSLTELMNYLQKNYNLLIESLSEKIKIKVKRQTYQVKYKTVSIDLCFDQLLSETNNGFMLECKYIKGNLEDFIEFNTLLASYDFLDTIESNKKELCEEPVVKPEKDPFSIKESPEVYNQKLDIYFAKEQFLLEKLKRLNARKEHLKDLHARYGLLEKTIVVTISGTPRAGKTTCIDNLFEFFKKADFKTACVEEPAGLVYATLKSKEEKAELLKDRIGFVERQLVIGEEEISKKLNDNEIILCDRGILDTFIWYDMYYKLGLMPKERYKEYLEKLKRNYPYFNQLYILYTSQLTSMFRDYQNSLSIEPRSTMNEDNVRRYNNSLIRMIPTFERNIDGIKFINTSDYAKMDASITIANDLIDKVENLYRRRVK